MLRRIRQTAAVLSIVAVTLLFLDFTGTAHVWLGWMAKIQFMPALLALNAGIVLGLLVLTFMFGRVYCSVICPLGIMQDLFGRLGKMARKNRYAYSAPKSILRYSLLVIMAVAILAGINVIVVLLAPYSSYGRIAQNLLSPVWGFFNNLLAHRAEACESYAFYTTDVWIRSVITFGVAAATLLVLGILSWRNGRTYCNTICPVGTLLGFVSRYSVFRPVIDTSKCNSCGLCARNCKSACIDSRNHSVDYSRCVSCFDCVEVCRRGAISYRCRFSSSDKTEGQGSESSTCDESRRRFMGAVFAIGAGITANAADKVVDGGLAVIEDKKIPKRKTRIVPPGARSINNLSSHCTACQLCIAACPNGVLRPSEDLESLMQPESSYERGYCRPECTKCSEVCPAGAIRPVTKEEKTSIQIGHAVWVRSNCVPLTDGVECGNCARHCPSGAIQMVPSVSSDTDSLKIPVINEERCIGCGACENLCPARPFSAIYVEGHENHREI